MRFRVTALIISLLSSASVWAQDPYDEVYATVVHSEPVYQTVEDRVPERQCWVEQVRRETYHQPRQSAASTVVGGVIGGALGHAVGHDSSNKKVGAAVGAVVGAAIGNDLGRRQERSGYTEVAYQDVERCETRDRIESYRELIGYNVTYEFNGRHYTTRTEREPGRQIRLAVQARPLDN